MNLGGVTETIQNGYSTPLSGKPITKTPVIVKKDGVTLEQYPEHYIPGKEPLADNEMRVTGGGLQAPLLNSARQNSP